MGLSAKTRSHPTKLPFIVTTENNMLCLRAMRHVRRGEVFDDPLGMEVPTVRHNCEIDGLRIMYNVFQQLPFYPGSMWHRNGLCSDRLGGWLTPDDRRTCVKHFAPPMMIFNRIYDAPIGVGLDHSGNPSVTRDLFGTHLINAELSAIPGENKLRLLIVNDIDSSSVVYARAPTLRYPPPCCLIQRSDVSHEY